MGRRNLSFLLAIVVLAAALRFSYLVYNPPSLNWDEVSHGYNAYSILKTGMDQWGQKFPVYNFRAYGDYPTTLNLYLTIPFILIFGLTEFAIRFPHALLGTLTVVSVYFFTWGLTRKKNISLVSALLVAMGPWYIFTSRFVLQSNLSVFLLATAAALFFNRDKRKYFLPLTFFTLFLTLFSYHTTRIFSPLLLMGSLLVYLPRSWKISVTALIFFVLTGIILQSPESRARGGLLFLVNQGAINRIIELRNSSNLPQVVKKIIYNRPVYFLEQFFGNYLNYFSPKFLFFEGGTQYQFSIPKTGLIVPVGLPFFYFGIFILLIKSWKNKDYRTVLLWLILSPVPASLTNESYAVVRATTMLPIPEVLIAIGIYSFLNWKIWNSLEIGNWKLEISSHWFWLIYVFVLISSTESYLTNYFTKYRQDYSWSWQYGYKQVAEYSLKNYSKYDKVIVTKKYGEPHEYFLFFTKWNPAKYQNDPDAIRFWKSNWYWIDRFDKFYFVNDWQIKDLVTESKIKIGCISIKCLLITSPGNYPSGWKKLETVKFLDGKPAFEIYDNKL